MTEIRCTLYSEAARLLGAVGDFSCVTQSGETLIVLVDGEWHGQSYSGMLFATLGV